MDIPVSKLFLALRWHRLKATLVNIRSVPVMTAHPVSIIQAIVKGVTISTGNNEELPIFFHITGRNHTSRMRASDLLQVEFFFFRTGTDYIARWKEAFRAYLSDPVTGRNFEIADIGEVEERSFDALAREHGVMKTEGEVCLEFLVPYPFRTEKGKDRTFLGKEALIRSLEKRFSKLFGAELAYKRSDDDFTVLPYYWKYTEIKHPSKSQPGHTQLINGCVGNLYLKGRFGGLMPFLILGSELHAGPDMSNSQGYYLLHIDPPGYFEKKFPDRKALLSAVRDVLDRYDNALESLSLTEKFPFVEDEFAESLCREMAAGAYAPSPNTAFLIRKKDGTGRVVEQLSFRDMIVQQYILKTVADNFERILEDESIGFRKGISRQKAIELVREAVGLGYRYVIESDIEDFFPSVDLKVLSRLLDLYLPEKDERLKNILLKIFTNGYLLDGELNRRVKGLAQGSPLSPLFANLYLDSFDEHVKSRDVRLIRYADDFVILTRTMEEAEEVLSGSEIFLSELGLKLKKEKTAVKPVDEGFRFLGMNFNGPAADTDPGERLKRLRKPLYITEPYLFLSVNGDAVDIRRQRRIVETIPLRRISEIMVMDRAVFSTALIRRCTDGNIPLTIVLNTGYYITTVKPDSKNYYDISFRHGRRFFSLSDTEALSIAKEFAAGKLMNYVTLFRHRYLKEQHGFIGEIERTAGRIHAAGSVNEVRGFEGATAKKIYQRLNGLIEHEAFHIGKRDRKKPDRINSLFNFGYYLLFSRINATVRAVGLNPYLGFLHSHEDNYESLVCDVEELFRPRMDRFIIRLINLKSITKDDFLETEKGFYLRKDSVKKFLDLFEAEMEKEGAGRRLSLKDNIYVQVDIIKKWALEAGPISFYRWQA